MELVLLVESVWNECGHLEIELTGGGATGDSLVNVLYMSAWQDGDALGLPVVDECLQLTMSGIFS